MKICRIHVNSIKGPRHFFLDAEISFRWIELLFLGQNRAFLEVDSCRRHSSFSGRFLELISPLDSYIISQKQRVELLKVASGDPLNY